MCCIEFPNRPVNVSLNTIQVISRVCELMQVPSLEAGRIKPWNIPALKDLQYTMREINMFIEVSKHVFVKNLDLTCMFGWYLSVFFLKKISFSLLEQSHPSVPCMSWANHWLAWRTRSTTRSWTWGPSANSPSSTACSRLTVTQRMMISTRLRQ